MKSLNLFGKIEPNQVANLICHGKAINPTFFSMRLAIISAALSASIKYGIGQVFLSVIRERINPGQIVETLIPKGAKDKRKPSPQALTQAFVAEYDGQVGIP